MKRIALLTVLLLALGLASGFAADAIAPTFVASATLNWGISLDTGVNGFTNVPSILLYIPLVSFQSLVDKGDGDFYGELDLTNIELEVQYDPLAAVPGAVFIQKAITVDAAQDASSVTASFHMVPWNLVMAVYAAPSMGLGHGTYYLTQTNAVYMTLSPFDTTADPVVPTSLTAAVLATPFAWAGTSLTWGTTPLSIALKVLSSADWTAATGNAYAVGVDGSAVVGPLTLGFGGYTAFNLAQASYTAPFQAFVTAAFVQEMDTMKVSAKVALDADLTGTAFSYELTNSDYFYISAAADADGKAQYTNWVGVDVLYGSLSSWNDFSLHFAAVEDAATGFLPGLGMKVEGNLVNLINALSYDVIANGSYKVALMTDVSLTPSVAFYYGMVNGTTGAILHLIPSVALSIGNVANITFSVTWTGDDLLPEGTNPMKLGNVVFAAVVTY